MKERIFILTVLTCIALVSAWFLNQLKQEESEIEAGLHHDPDYYMEDFVSHSMNKDGTLKHKVQAVYMAHYPDNDTTELYSPEMEIFRQNNVPLFIKAKKGWVTADNDIILLRGKVRMWEMDKNGVTNMQVETTDVKVLLSEEYAETDQYATIISKGSTITGTGMRAHFKEGRLEVLNHERTIIKKSSGG